MRDIARYLTQVVHQLPDPVEHRVERCPGGVEFVATPADQHALRHIAGHDRARDPADPVEPPLQIAPQHQRTHYAERDHQDERAAEQEDDRAIDTLHDFGVPRHDQAISTTQIARFGTRAIKAFDRIAEDNRAKPVRRPRRIERPRDAAARTVEQGVSKGLDRTPGLARRDRTGDIGETALVIFLGEVRRFLPDQPILLTSKIRVGDQIHREPEQHDRQREGGRVSEGDTVGGAGSHLRHRRASDSPIHGSSRSDHRQSPREAWCASG